MTKGRLLAERTKILQEQNANSTKKKYFFRDFNDMKVIIITKNHSL